jgi:hypothetical protein
MSESTHDRTVPPAGHPTDRQLSAYQAGQLAPGEEDELQEHLVVCRECTERLLILADFQELMEADDLETMTRPEELPSPSQTQASWQAVQARVAASHREAFASRPAPPPLPVESRFRRLTASSTTVFALAASLFACLIGFPLWIATHGDSSAGAPIVVYPLGGGEVHRGSRDSGQPFTVRLNEAPAVLALPLPARAAFPTYRIEVWTPGGELRLSARALPAATAVEPGKQAPSSGDRPPRLLVVVLGQGQLAVGDYRLRLVGERGSRDEVIAEHALRVPAI